MDPHTLSRRLAALPALEMRRAVLGECLRGLSTDAAARVCSELIRRSVFGAPYDVALVALTALLDGGDVTYEWHENLYEAARRLGDESLQRLLLSARSPPPGQPQRVPIPGRPQITLGERKQLARGSLDRNIIDRLLHDDHPGVLEILLGNPRLVESDVVRIAARRPTAADLQRVIARCERFIQRYEVKRALALNPYTPTDLAGRILPMLNRNDLKRMAEDQSLDELLRASAKELLGRL